MCSAHVCLKISTALLSYSEEKLTSVHCFFQTTFAVLSVASLWLVLPAYLPSADTCPITFENVARVDFLSTRLVVWNVAVAFLP